MMTKTFNKSIFFIVIISSLFFINNVSAESLESKSTHYYDVFSSKYNELFDKVISSKPSNHTEENINQVYNDTLTMIKQQHPYYFSTISLSNASNDFTINFYAFDEKIDIDYNVYFEYSSSNYLLKLSYSNRSKLATEYWLYSFTFGKSGNNLKVPSSSGFHYNVSSNSNIFYTFLNFSTNPDVYSSSVLRGFLLDTNLDYKLTNKYNECTTKQCDVDLKIGDYYYQDGDVFPTFKEYYYPTPQTPTIKLKSENTLFNNNQEPIQSKITVDWGIKDLAKYKYMWRKSNDENWKYFFSEEQIDEILVNQNASYYFQVNDLEDNFVTAATITITSLSEELPTLKLDSYTSPSCFYNEQQICDIVTLYSDNADFSKYTLQYHLSNGDWITHNYENSAKGQIVIYENTTITARLIRNSDNKLIDSKTHTITKINSEIITDTPTFKFERTFCTNLEPNTFHEVGEGNFKQTLLMTIYGLDLTKHRVFISTDNANTFTEIKEFEYEDRVPTIKHYYFEFYQDTALIVKITDLEENYVTAITYNMHFTCNDVSKPQEFDNMKSIFDYVKNFFEKFKNTMSKFTEIIEYFYNSMNSEIKAFILTAFILIVVLNLIMRMMK